MTETRCYQDPIEDIGHGVTIERRYIDGALDGIAYWHSGCTLKSESYVPVDQGVSEHYWTLESEQPLTLSPSLLCRACGHHGFIREGKWVPC